MKKITEESDQFLDKMQVLSKKLLSISNDLIKEDYNLSESLKNDKESSSKSEDQTKESRVSKNSKYEAVMQKLKSSNKSKNDSELYTSTSPKSFKDKVYNDQKDNHNNGNSRGSHRS